MQVRVLFPAPNIPEHLQRFETGVTAPLIFGPNQRVGSAGAVILALDPPGHAFVPVSGWITPKN
jgi:hypothetical protein